LLILIVIIFTLLVKVNERILTYLNVACNRRDQVLINNLINHIDLILKLGHGLIWPVEIDIFNQS